MMLANFALASDVLFVGPGADLADGSNWSQSSWTSSDTLVIASNNFEVSESGLVLSRDLPPSKALEIGAMPARTVPMDFGGHALNTELTLKRMHADSERFNPVLASGGWTGVSRISSTDHSVNLHLTNGVFYADQAFSLCQWNNYLHILKGATLAITNVNASLTVFGTTQKAILDINGGTMRISGPRNDHMLRRLDYKSGGNTSEIKIRNGGAYVDDTVYHQDYFSQCSVLVDGGSYIATNTISVNRNLIFVGPNTRFAVTNGTVRIAQFYTGTYCNDDFKFGNEIGGYGRNAMYTFHNSEVTFGYPARPSDARLHAGFAFSPLTTNSVLRLSGGSNAWQSHCLMLNGLANRVEIDGGTFDVTRILRVADGGDCSVEFAGGTSAIAKMAVTDTATNFTMRVAAGASVSVAGELSIAGTNACVAFSGQNPSLSAGKFSIGGSATLRFALPSGGYAAAPLTSDDPSMGCSVGDGTIFEIDMSGYEWTESKKIIPLLHDAAGFSAGIDIAKLNETNAGRMPSNMWRKCRLGLSDNGKTLVLVVPGPGGFAIYCR